MMVQTMRVQNATADQNEKVQQAWINFIYSPVKPVDLGIEYLNGERKTLLVKNSVMIV